MKIRFFLLLFLCLTGFETIKSVDYKTIPLANKIEFNDGFTFTINKQTTIVVAGKSTKQKQNALFLQKFIFERCGLKLKISSRAAKSGVIELLLDDKIQHPEGYTLKVDNYKVQISGKTEAGVFYGIQTLGKSLPMQQTEVKLPPVLITDAPRFNYRGMHLDVSRHFFSVDFVKKYIDILALHHVNTFHWHLTDDQGWRIEIKKYPQLTKIGSVRKQTIVGRDMKNGKYDSIPYGGFYTQKQIKEVIRYAAERYITIIPEVDMPGHMLAALTTFPELGCTHGPYEVAQKWGIFDDVFCPGSEDVYEFAQNVLTEVMQLFPSKYIHIGGDECLKNKWKTCQRCQARIATLGLKSDSLHSAEERLQSYFITRMQKFVNEKGREIIGWDEILEGGLAPNAIVMSWRGIKGGIAAAKMGHSVIMTPNSHMYFDYYQTTEREKVPLAIGGYVPLERVYEFEPIPVELNDVQSKYILGVQANLWTEFIPTESHVEYMLLPRLSALSEVQWTNNANKNYNDFLLRLPVMKTWFEAKGYNYYKQ